MYPRYSCEKLMGWFVVYNLKFKSKWGYPPLQCTSTYMNYVFNVDNQLKKNHRIKPCIEKKNELDQHK